MGRFEICPAGSRVCLSTIGAIHPCRFRATMEAIMSFFDNGPLGPWPEEFAFKGEGCIFTLIGLIIFLAAVLILSHFFFN